MSGPVMMSGKLACMRLRSWRHLKPGKEKRIYKRMQRARERREARQECGR